MIRRGWILALAFTALGCPGGKGDATRQETVAVAGSRTVTRAELDDYLVSHLQMEGEEEWESDAVTPEVKSRLLDELIREILLADEARRAGFLVTPAEIDRWIAGGPEDHRLSRSEEDRRRLRAEREILVQKVLEATARSDPSEGAVEAKVEEVLAAAPVRIFVENVPFPYVPEPGPLPGS